MCWEQNEFGVGIHSYFGLKLFSNEPPQLRRGKIYYFLGAKRYFEKNISLESFNIFELIFTKAKWNFPAVKYGAGYIVSNVIEDFDVVAEVSFCFNSKVIEKVLLIFLYQIMDFLGLPHFFLEGIESRTRGFVKPS